MRFITIGSMQPAIIAAWAAVLSAIFAGITVSVSLRRARRLMIAPMRLEWISTVRQHVTEFTAETTRLNHDYNILGTGKPDKDIRKNIVLLEHRIRLLLNPDEPAHQELVNAVHALGVACLTKDLDDFGHLLELTLGHAQTVLRTEWRKVKKLR